MQWLRSVVVIAADFESADPGSNPDVAFLDLQCTIFYILTHMPN